MSNPATAAGAVPDTPPQQPGTRPASTQKQRTLGSDGKPVRAIAFASGGFDTVMQLGVIHALLVIQGKAPDAVVGVSAGAVNATALAEVFQAGSDPADWSELDDAGRQEMLRDRQRARVLKLRKMLEAYLEAPGDLARAFLPDTLQVDAERPLRPLELPIHDLLEREGRGRELQARQGFINLFNDLLGLRVSFATLTRLIRRYLGWQWAAEIHSRVGRAAVRLFELARVWALIAANFPRAAIVVARLVRPLFGSGSPTHEAGATAATIIFEPLWLRALKRAAAQILWPIGLLLVWTGITLLVVGLPLVPLLLARWGLHRLPLLPNSGWLVTIATELDQRLAIWAVAGYAGLAVLAILTLLVTGAWNQIVIFNRSSSRAVIGEVVKEGAAMLVLLVAGLALPLAFLVGLEIAQKGLSGGLRPSREHVEWVVMWSVVALLGLAVIAAVVTAPFRRKKDSYLRRLLARYDLADGLLSPHPLKQLFIQLFDPQYYGRRLMDDVVDRALRDDYSPSRTEPYAKLIRTYESSSPRIAVGLMVANVRTGELEIVPDSTKVVDGLLAATAVSPLFPPKPIMDQLYLDGANISTEATSGALSLLRDRIHPHATVVHLYSVSHLPFSRPSLGPAPGRSDDDGYLNLVDVASRALQLQRFRDAALERRTTELYTRVIPPGKAVYEVGKDRFLRVWVAPVEPEAPLDLNERITRCGGPKESRQIMIEAVADGCRAALEVMIRSSMPHIASDRTPCRQAVQAHLNAPGVPFTLPLLVNLDPANPASPVAPPGLPEVCRHCALARAPRAVTEADQAALKIRVWQDIGPAWPHELLEEPVDQGAAESDAHFERVRPDSEGKTIEALSRLKESYWRSFSDQAAKQWPRNRGQLLGHERPLVSFLFSGGVFRGVYQMGTLSAISEAGLVPDVIAGASVGSITGAMVAQALALPEGPARDGRIARLAATYLAMDRLVLTDRFADFIRGLTLRAASTRFSLQQADRFLRRYDQPDSAKFDEEARLVMAGLERLFWLSPFELKRLVKALRLQQSEEVYELLRKYAQEWLDRMSVGNQVLGAEPLALLITEHVLKQQPDADRAGPEAVGFDRYLQQSGVFFLATTTNLTQGQLEVLGEHQLLERDRATLLEGLLASSAFPGVFRPRWSWEVMAGSTKRDQYIDGGVMDNLPLDAVAHFLRLASEPDVGIVARRPSGGTVPHLLFSASLEILPDEPDPETMNRYLNEWPMVWSRAKQLRYNKKLRLYADTQRAIRAIWIARGQRGPFEPLDLEVVMVQPRWLCGTFGFHPMLGFRRQRQVESIAHGCATALLELARVAQAHPLWAAGWGLDTNRLPKNPPATDKDPIVPGKATDGKCWFRPGIDCPFGEQRLQRANLPGRTRQELSQIHVACGRRETHSSR